MLIDEQRWQELDKLGQTLSQLFADALEEDPSKRVFDLDLALQKEVGTVEGLDGIDLLPSSLRLIDVQDRLATMPQGRFYTKAPTEILHTAVKGIIDQYDIADAVTKILADGGKAARSTGQRRGQRRAAPIVDPFEIYRNDPASLASRLAQLNLEQLRDVIAHYGMDPRRLAMKWKASERVVEHVVTVVEARSRKGDVFRSPAPEQRNTEA